MANAKNPHTLPGKAAFDRFTLYSTATFLTAFCCHRGRVWHHPWCMADAPRSPAPSMPVRKYYSARRWRLPL